MIAVSRHLCWLWLAAALAGCGGAGKHAAPVREAGTALRTPAAARQVQVPQATPPGHYRVQTGDTLYKIAFELGLDYRDIAAWNRLADAGRIQAGQLLRLSAPAGQPAGVSPAPVSPASTKAEDKPDTWAWPSRGELIARYGAGRNKGIDIAGKSGQPVLAAASGTVAYTGVGLRGYGKLIIIRHGSSLLSAYAHLQRIHLKEGQTVARGQPVGEMGDSDAERVKLHFEIREYGKPVDPLNYLPGPLPMLGLLDGTYRG